MNDLDRTAETTAATTPVTRMRPLLWLVLVVGVVAVRSYRQTLD